MRSFDAVFSRRGRNGQPERICNPKTGEIDSFVVSAWKRYDISLYLVNNWDRLKTSLKGKIRITSGEFDNFLLKQAVHLLDDKMTILKADIVFQYYRADHFTIFSDEYNETGDKFLADKYREWLTTTSHSGKP